MAARADAAVTHTVIVKMPESVAAHGWRFLNGAICLGSTKLQPQPAVLSKIWTNPALYAAQQLPSGVVDQQASKQPTSAGEIRYLVAAKAASWYLKPCAEGAVIPRGASAAATVLNVMHNFVLA